MMDTEKTDAIDEAFEKWHDEWHWPLSERTREAWRAATLAERERAVNMLALADALAKAVLSVAADRKEPCWCKHCDFTAITPDLGHQPECAALRGALAAYQKGRESDGR